MIELRITIDAIIEDTNGRKSVQWSATSAYTEPEALRHAHSGVSPLGEAFGFDIETSSIRVHQYYKD